MLKSLLTRIKQEKSETLSNKQSKTHLQAQESHFMKPIGSYQFAPLTEESVVKCPFDQIRYAVQPQAPNIYNRVLSCPLSVFNILPYGKRKVKEIDLKVHPSPEYISHMKTLLENELPTYNHILINVYPPGVGIMPHFDGPMYLPKVVVLSLGGPAIIKFSQTYANTSSLGSLLLEDQSIHIFEGTAYEKYLHGIADIAVDSVFLKVSEESPTSQASILDSSVINFEKTRLFKAVDMILKDKQLKSLSTEIDMSKEYGSPCCLIPIRENPQYNFKVQLVREERISITVREKYQEK